MDRIRSELAATLMALLERTYLFMREGPLDALGDLELTKGQIRALVLLRRSPQRMTDIASHLGTGLSAATSLIERLVDKGLVERVQDPRDRRVVICQPSTAGDELVGRLYRMGQEKIAALAATLTVDELRAVIAGMQVLAAAVERQAARSSPSSPGRPGQAERFPRPATGGER